MHAPLRLGATSTLKAGVYAPETSKGRETLLHELTHVVQQSSIKSKGGKLKLGARGSAQEHEAERMARKIGQNNAHSLGGSVGTVQRMGGEEEEPVQGQFEEEEVQTQGEEEEIQTQPDSAAVIQREGEEEEVQTQPDAVAVVQRDGEDDKWTKDAKTNKWSPQAKPGIGAKLKGFFSRKPKTTGPVDPEHNPPPITGIKKHLPAPPPKPGMSFADELKGKAEARTHKMGNRTAGIDIETKERALGVASTEFKNETHTKEGMKRSAKRQETNKDVNREMLVKTLKDTSSSPEEMKAAEEKLRTLHKRHFRKNYATTALKERKKSLEERAKGGDDKAYEQLKKENPSKMTKLLNFGKGIAGKAQGFYKQHESLITGSILPKVQEYGPKVAGMLGSLLGSGKKSSGEGDGGGGGGGGGGSGVAEIMKEYAKLKQENKELKKKLMEKQQSPVPGLGH